MKNWWLNLSIKEKQAVSIAAALLILFLAYELTLASLQNKVQSLRHKIHTENQLLAWMQENDAQIRSFEKNISTNDSDSSQSLLSLFQAKINTSSFVKSVTQLQQAENDAIQIRFQQVGFDSLYKWLIGICREKNLIIVEAVITPGSVNGVVDASFKLARN